MTEPRRPQMDLVRWILVIAAFAAGIAIGLALLS